MMTGRAFVSRRLKPSDDDEPPEPDIDVSLRVGRRQTPFVASCPLLLEVWAVWQEAAAFIRLRNPRSVNDQTMQDTQDNGTKAL
jgi:hypothetical protein